jgi:hypothetical protein
MCQQGSGSNDKNDRSGEQPNCDSERQSAADDAELNGSRSRRSTRQARNGIYAITTRVAIALRRLSILPVEVRRGLLLTVVDCVFLSDRGN